MSTVSTLDAELTALFAGERLADPYPVFHAVREASPVYRWGSSIVLTRFEDVRDVLADQERYSNEFWIRGTRPMEILAGFSSDGQRKWRELAAYDSNFITRNQGEKHERLRKSAHRYFTPRRIQDMSGAIQGFVDDLLDEVSREEVYDQRWLAGDLALRVMSHVIGSPQVDREHLRSLADVRGRYLGTPHEQLVHEAYEANREFDAYVREVILAEHRRSGGANELAAALLAAEDEARLSTEEVIAVIINLIIGGLETTAVLFANGLLELMRNRDQWRKLCDDPGLAPSAVEELLRYVSPAQWSQRIAKDDFEWDGVEIPAETTMITAIAAANRDPSVFDAPDTLDITRDATHLGLGYGAHFCLGASLIRNEAAILLRTLATRYPDIELAIDPADLDWTGSNPLMRCVRSLPMRLGARRAA